MKKILSIISLLFTALLTTAAPHKIAMPDHLTARPRFADTTKTNMVVVKTASAGHGWYLKDVGGGRAQYIQITADDIAHLVDSLSQRIPYTNAAHDINFNSKSVTFTFPDNGGGGGATMNAAAANFNIKSLGRNGTVFIAADGSNVASFNYDNPISDARGIIFNQPFSLNYNFETAYGYENVLLQRPVSESGSHGQIRAMPISYFATAASLGNYLPRSGGVVTGDIQSSVTPVNGNSLVNRGFVENLVFGLSWKNAVRVKTTGNITLSGTQTIDTVAVVAGNRVLVNNQTDARQNGIYVADGGAWTRASDVDSGDEISSATIVVMSGKVYKNTQWTHVDSTVPVIGTDNIYFTQISGPGTYTNGTGLSLTANVFSLNTSYVRGLFSATGPILYNSTTGVFSAQQASGSQAGILSATDFASFAAKQSAGNYLTGLTGEVTASGPGAVAATINRATAFTWTSGHVWNLTSGNALTSQNAGVTNFFVDFTGRTKIDRTINDATALFTINQGNVSATGALASFQVSNSEVAKVLSGGYFSGAGLSNIAGSNNALITTSANGTVISRNVSDANTALAVNKQVGTGFIFDAQFGGATKFNIDVNGNAKATQYRLTALNTAPASSTDTGTAGEVRFTSSYLYLCTATNTWVRSAFSTF